MDRTSPLSEFQALFNVSLHAVAPYSKNAVSVQGPPPELHPLHENIQYSRNFILTYIPLQLILLFSVTAFHWVRRFRCWRRSKRKRTGHQRLESYPGLAAKPPSHVAEATDGFGDESSRASSSSSTLRDIPQRINDGISHWKVDEQSPLLLQSHRDPKRARKGQIGLRAKSWLIYQPKPIYFINKTPSANGTTLAVLAMIGIQVFYCVYRVPFSIPTLYVFADRTSLVFAANLPLLYLFAAKNQPIKLLTGYSYESLNIFHRRFGEIMCLLAFFHSVGMFVVWYTILRPAGFELITFLLEKIILWGMAAFVAYESLYFTSLGSFRQRWYELFLGLHVILQILALVFLWLHFYAARPYVGAALAIFLLDRLIYRMILKTKTAKGTLEVKDDKSTVVVRISIPTSETRRPWSSFPGANITNGWKATEHIFLTVSALSRKHIFQAHPFTISSKAPSIGDTDLNLELIIRAHDGFSRDLLQYAQGHQVVTARLDGPYGSQSAVRMLQARELSIIIAGGSGIAVTWPLVHSILAARQDADPELSAGSSPAAATILFLWIIRDSSHRDWLGSPKLEELQSHGVDVVVPSPTARNGHPDIGHLIGSWIDARVDFSRAEQPQVGVVCSGPDSLNRSVRNVCSALLRNGHDVNIEIEKFGW